MTKLIGTFRLYAKASKSLLFMYIQQIRTFGSSPLGRRECTFTELDNGSTFKRRRCPAAVCLCVYVCVCVCV